MCEWVWVCVCVCVCDTGLEVHSTPTNYISYALAVAHTQSIPSWIIGWRIHNLKRHTFSGILFGSASHDTNESDLLLWVPHSSMLCKVCMYVICFWEAESHFVAHCMYMPTVVFKDMALPYEAFGTILLCRNTASLVYVYGLVMSTLIYVIDASARVFDHSEMFLYNWLMCLNLCGTKLCSYLLWKWLKCECCTDMYWYWYDVIRA